MITESDVRRVANDTKRIPSEEQIKEILELYPSEQEQDPSATWDLVVDNLLWTLNVPFKKYFFRTMKIRNGEYEYYSNTCFESSSMEKAKEHANHEVCNFYQDAQPQEDGGAYHWGGEVHVSLYKLEEVTEIEYLVLKKYI